MGTKQTLSFAASLMHALPSMDEKTMQDWIENPVQLKQALRTLRNYGPQFITKAGVDIFKIEGSCSDLWSSYQHDGHVFEISKEFRQEFLPEGLNPKTVTLPEIRVLRTETSAFTSDMNLRKELPNEHVFKGGFVLLRVMVGLVRLNNWHNDYVLSNTNWNLFFIERNRGGTVFTVSVGRNNKNQWRLHCNYPGTTDWPEGTQIFYPAT